MFSQVTDFAAESTAFGGVLDAAIIEHGDTVFTQPTQFKQWTLNDILGHLHIWNWAADTSLNNPKHFQEFLALVMNAVQRGQMRQFERQWLKELHGETLLTTWRNYVQETSARFAQADPAERMAWAGPNMSVRSCVTARLMETWSHAQAVYDLLGIVRKDEDRIKNIVVLGINTFGWSFKNRGLTPPEPAPYVVLSAPSGAQWTFNSASSNSSITGTATEFCQVVTQVRNVLDTELRVEGQTAKAWMETAQCFAGPPEQPPAPGSRFVATTAARN